MTPRPPCLCACGCGQVLKGTARQRYVDNAHRQRAHRRRETRRAQVREASVAEAIAARRAAPLRALLEPLVPGAGGLALRVGAQAWPLERVALEQLVGALAGDEGDRQDLPQFIAAAEAAAEFARRTRAPAELGDGERLVALRAADLEQLVILARTTRARAAIAPAAEQLLAPHQAGAAAPGRAPGHLAALLEAAAVEARRWPGSVVLRAGGRLTALSADELEQLAAAARR